MQHPSRELTDLNLDVLLEILGYLDLKSLVTVAQTCPGLRDAAYTPQLWKHCTINVPTGYSLTELTAKSLCDRKINHLRLLVEPVDQVHHEIQTASLANCFKYVAVESLHLVQEPFLIYPITLPNSIDTVLSLDQTLKMDLWRFIFNPEDYKQLLWSVLNSVTLLEKLKLTMAISSNYIADKSQQEGSEDVCFEFYDSWENFDYFALVLRCLPQLKDFDLIEDVCDQLFQSEMYVNPTKKIEPTNKYLSLERLSVRHQTQFTLRHIPDHFSNLKHLYLRVRH